MNLTIGKRTFRNCPITVLTFPTLVPQVALYLCKELPLSLWQPRSEEICVIGAWLLQHPLSAVENRLACVILEGLNWGYTQVMPVALKKKKKVTSMNPERICESVAHLVFFCRAAPWRCLLLSTPRWLCS